jgi:negative regulator of genetic competence, sporulation and motility
MDKNKIIENTEKTLDVFKNILNTLNIEENLVLGGSTALRLHGINTKRVPEDVDIILFCPTIKQFNFLKSIEDFSDFTQDKGYEQVYKFRKVKDNKTFTLDILIEHYAVPRNLLLLKRGKLLIKVQDIDSIIAAKSRYGRDKDLKDMLDMKNLNFNPFK